MVEFPLLVRRSARALQRRLENVSQIPPFADINFASSNRPLTQAGMWETNTFAASFHARLNVALRHDCGASKWRKPDIGRVNRAPRPICDGSQVQFFINSAARWPA